MPSRGWNCFFDDGIMPVDGNPGLPMKGAKKTWLGRRDRVRLDLRVPAQAVAHGQIRADLPLVLNEERRLQLRNGLRAGVARCSCR